MDLSQIVLNTLPSLLKYFFAPASIIFLVGVLLTYSRSRSSHPILLKMWSLLFGKLEIHSDKIQKFSNNQTDLAHFTFLTKIKVGTLPQAERLVTWAAERDINLRLIKDSGSYFDPALPGPTGRLYEIKPRHLLVRVIAALLLALPIFFGIVLGVYDRAILQMRSTQNYLTVNSEYVTPFLSGQRFLLSDCDKSPPITFEKSDIESICKIEFSRDVQLELNSIVKTQKVLGIFFTVYAGFFFFKIYVSILRIQAATRLRKKLA